MQPTMMKDVAVVALVLFTYLQAAPRPPKPGVKTPGVKIPIEKLKPEAVYAVPGSPDWLAIDPVNKFTWGSNEPKDTVSRLDPASNGVTTSGDLSHRVAASRTCVRISSTSAQSALRPVRRASIWRRVAATCGPESPSRRDRSSPARENVWIMTSERPLARIDPATNAVVAEVYVPSGSYGIAFGEGGVWVTSTAHDSVTRVDPQTNLIVETIPVGKAPRFVAAGLGAVWTLNQGDGSVSRVDPKTNKVVATIEVGVPGGGGEIAAGEGSVWVTAFRVRPCRGSIRDEHGRAAVLRRGRRLRARRSRLGVAVESARGKRVAPRPKRSRRRCRIDQRRGTPHVRRPSRGRPGELNPKDQVFMRSASMFRSRGR
jgi:YVTN family beta-propeller protein